MKNYLKSKIFLGSFLILFGSLWFNIQGVADEVTVQDILDKMQQNISGINDMKAEVVTTAHQTTQRMKYLFKKYDKYKIECLFSNPQVFVISNQRVRIKDVDGKIIDVSLLEVLNQFLPSQEYFNLDTKYIRENFNIILNDALSDKSQNLYVLECIPKIFNSGTFKIEMCVDCSKGISVRNRIYKEANILIGVSEVKESRLIDDIWIPISIEYTIFPSEGQEIKVTKRFESVQVNTGIPDSEFEIE